MPAVKQARRTETRVSVANWRHNIRALRAHLRPGVKLMAVVKADAYGHGLVPFSLAAQQEQVDWLGVALAEEGRSLRQSGVTLPILVLGALNHQGMLEAARHSLTVTVADAPSVYRAQKAAVETNRALKAHMKLDTGMHRIGAGSESDVRAILLALAASPMVKLTGVFTHLADADSPDPAYTDRQLEKFSALCASLPDGLLRHTAASAATLHRPDAHFDMVRPGICLYGCPPVETDIPLKPCLSLYGEVVFVKDVAAGAGIGYGHTFVTDKPIRVATIAAGYGDGYRRALSGKARVLIGGISCPVLGRVCMDQFMVDASNADGIAVGQQATLLGGEGEAAITAQELAGLADTITYEILLSPSARVPRKYDEPEWEAADAR